MTTQELPDQRAQLRDREHAVLTDLLAGRIPAGFDPAGSAMTTTVLIAKRWAAVRSLAPELVHLADARQRFGRYAVHRQTDCAHTDLTSFVDWLAADADRSATQWLRLHAVHDGRRRYALAMVNGRRVLAVGIGGTVWHLALVPPATTTKGARQ
ncbi:hypothetical protein [Nakamurella aerolata]|uniref:SCO6045-like C-terminal domain-containing protein n=1 Tax=Nakamurella aerolata TaxID=1656892 RepID=A0A849ADC8_9ACTN|nr:hypothetical protein [Nakamurella aerolata]NNG37188.1 hypothetical protein [Nakamurella aerolata]